MKLMKKKKFDKHTTSPCLQNTFCIVAFEFIWLTTIRNAATWFIRSIFAVVYLESKKTSFSLCSKQAIWQNSIRTYSIAKFALWNTITAHTSCFMYWTCCWRSIIYWITWWKKTNFTLFQINVIHIIHFVFQIQKAYHFPYSLWNQKKNYFYFLLL